MPEMPDVVPSELIEAEWGNDIRDRTIQRFANWADALAAYPSPNDGDTIVILDPNLFGVYTWVVNRWQSSPDTGTIMAFGGLISSPQPRGWLICGGTAVSRTTYARLFAVCGTAFGDGDGSTTFNLPNLVNAFPRGAPAANLGETGGSATHSHAAGTLATSTAGAHTHNLNTSGAAMARTSPPFEYPLLAAGSTGEVTQSGGAHSHNVTTGTTAAASNLPPYINVRWIIKT